MAKKEMDSVYRIVDVIGSSEKSWEDAGRRAVETAAGSFKYEGFPKRIGERRGNRLRAVGPSHSIGDRDMRS